MEQHLTGAQLQYLQDRFGLVLDLEDGVAIASRKSGSLKPETVAKMLGMKEVPSNWKQDEYGRVRGL